MHLNNIRMSAKLPMAFVALSLVVALVISWMGYRDFKASLVTLKKDLLETLAVERANAIESWFVNIDEQLVNYAVSPSTISAMQGFSSTFGLLMDDPVSDLQTAYIDENPNPIGQKDLYDRAPEAVPYNFQHEQFHPVFRAINDQLRLYDLFVLDLDGNLVYSVYKERDYATNMETGPYRDSGLADAFRMARDGAAGESYFADFRPYAPSADAPASFLSTPIVNPQGQTIGVMAFQIPANEMSTVINRAQGLGQTGDITMIGPDLLARTKSRFDSRHSILDPLTPNDAVLSVLGEASATYVDDISLNGNLGLGVARRVNAFGNSWIIVGEMDLSEVYSDATSQRNKTLIFTMIAMVVVALCGWLVSRTFSNPLEMVAKAMQRVSERDYDVHLPDLNRRDEIGELSRAVAMTADRLRAFDDKLAAEKEEAMAQKFAIDELAAGLQRLAEQDFSRPLSIAFAEEYEPLRANYNDIVERLGETISGLKAFSSTLDTQTDQIGRDSNELSQRTENQASTLEETAAAIDQITESITQNSEDLRNAENLILETDEHVKQGRAVVENTTKAMDEIEKSSEEISSIIRVVDDIAFQTNLLALNAGVEAARAGDAGRGFAVVAAEVRQLAMRSTDAVSQIKSQIDTSTANVGSGVALVRETESVLMEIVQRMEGISTAISSVAAGASEQSGSIGEINTGVNNLDRVTQQNAMMVENSNTSVQALSDEAANLARMLSNFKLGIHDNSLKRIDNSQFSSRRSA